MSRMSEAAKGSLRIHIDGAARGNPGPAGVGIVLQEPATRRSKEVSLYLGETTNNVAESCALILALQTALQMKAVRVSVFTDSELLSRQVTGEYRVKDARLQWLHVLIRNLIQGFDSFEIQHIPREKNRLADRLAGRAVSENLKKNPAGHRKKAAIAESSNAAQPTFF